MIANTFPCKSTNPSSNANYAINGPLVVLAGATGSELWNTYNDPNVNVGMAVSTTPAVVDLDGDGYLDIVFATAVQAPDPAVKTPWLKYQITALDYHSRQIKWTYRDDANFVCSVICMVSVADIDGDGKPEVVVGNVILDSRGLKKNFLTPAPSNSSFAATLADLDPTSPGLEIVVSGGIVYSSSGSKLFDTNCRGFSAVADLNRDGTSKLICTGTGKVSVYSGKGALEWQKNIPVSAANMATRYGKLGGGAPNIGHFNGDGKLDIGVAGGDYYVVYSSDGGELWRSPTQDNSSAATGSSLFDFNGDGKVEVVYNDEQKLRIFDGATGTVLWETENRSGTLYEYPLIVNVDDDDSTEIVVSSPTASGIRAFKDPSHTWVGSRRIWNQYSYYPEIVDDKGKAPIVSAAPSGFRVNTQGAAKIQQLGAPNLSVVAPFYADDVTEGNRDLTLSFYVFNRGGKDASQGYKLTVYESDGTTVLGSANASEMLAAMQGKLVSVKLDKQPKDKLSLMVELVRTDSSALQCAAEVKQNKFELKSLHR